MLWSETPWFLSQPCQESWVTCERTSFLLKFLLVKHDYFMCLYGLLQNTDTFSCTHTHTRRVWLSGNTWRKGWRKEWEKWKKLGPMDICPRDGPDWVLFFSVAVFASFGLKIKCPVLALITPFIFIFIRLKLHNLPRTNCDLKHLMCVGKGRGKKKKASSPTQGGKMLM